MTAFSKRLVDLICDNACLIFIIAIGAVLRFYKIKEYMFFAGDQGRDILSAAHLLLYGIIPLSGPLGSGIPLLSPPTYFYLITLLYLLSGMNIFILQCLVILLGIGSIPLSYFVTKELSSKKAALFTAILYSFSSLMISFSRSVTQPFTTPFFLLFFIFFLLKAFNQKKYAYFLISLPLFIIWVQLYYASLILVPVFIFWIFYVGYKIQPDKKFFFYHLLILFFVAYLLYLPFISYEVIYNFPNSKTLINFLGESGNGLTISSFLTNLKKSLFYLFKTLRYDSNRISLEKIPLSLLFFILLLILNLKTFIKKKVKFPFIFLGSIIFSGFVLFNFYLIGGRLGVPFLIPLYPFLIILIGILIDNINIGAKQVNKFIKPAILALTVILLFNKGYKEMLATGRKNEYQKTKTAVDFILAEVKRKKINNFDLFVISDVDKWNWDAPPFWLLIEKRLKKQFVAFIPESNKLKLTKRQPSTLFLICKNTNGGPIPENCPDDFLSNPFFSDFSTFSKFEVIKKFITPEIKIYTLGNIK